MFRLAVYSGRVIQSIRAMFAAVCVLKCVFGDGKSGAGKYCGAFYYRLEKVTRVSIPRVIRCCGVAVFYEKLRRPVTERQR